MTDSSMQVNPPRDTAQESGFVLLAVLVTLLPLIIIAGAASSYLIGNAGRMRERIAAAKALAAAEAGIDLAVFELNRDLLGSGLVEDLGSGVKAIVTVENLLTDGLDNDGDSLVDEADEDVFRIFSVGEYRGVRRTLVALLGVRSVALTITGAVGIESLPSPNFQFATGLLVSGKNHNPDGTLGDPTYDVVGIMCPPAQLATLTAEVSAAEALIITGVGGVIPSLGTGTIDVAAAVEGFRLAADRVLSGSSYNNIQWGDASTADYQVTYAGHGINIRGTSSGAGILVVDGAFEPRNTFSWTGVIIVTGVVRIKHDSRIIGAILSKSGDFWMHHNSKVLYSKQVVDAVNLELGGTRVVLFNGWQRVKNQ